MSNLVLRALAKQPSDRFPSVRELREAVERWAGDVALVEAAAFHVVHRARTGNKPEAGVAPAESTSPMAKLEKESLVDRMRMEMAAAPTDSGGNGANDSVEASLEDFISQANKSFQEPADGWTLNTDEVELVTEADLAPVQPAKIAAAVKGAPVIAKGAAQAAPEAQPNLRSTKMGIAVAPTLAAEPAQPRPDSRPPPASGPLPIALPTPTAQMSPPPVATEPSMPVAAAPPPAVEPAVPEKVVERTEVVSAPLPAPAPVVQSGPVTTSGPVAMPMAPVVSGQVAAPATSNPLVLFGIIFGAFVLGAVVVFALLKFMLQPQVTTAPVVTGVQLPSVATPVAAPAVVTPVPQMQVAPAPVVTPLQPTAPVVTPLPPPVAPVAAVPPPEEAKRPTKVHKPIAAPPKERPERAEKPVRAEKPPVAATPRERPERAEKPVKPEKPASKPAKPEKKSGGTDWVDPF
jgi:hypothetical protein